MTQEQANYRNNLLAFVEKSKGSLISKIDFYIDTDPTFKKAMVPFEFKYCHSVVLFTNIGIYKISSGAMTSEGFNTFWIENHIPSYKAPQTEILNAEVKNIQLQYNNSGYGYKIVLELSDKILTFFAAEIYNTVTDQLEYKLNDEMILVFESNRDIEVFENLAKIE